MPIAFYRCKTCKREFNNFADARTCEKEHLTIKGTRIKSYGIHKHPYEVEITFSNGDVIVYVPVHMQF